MIRNAVCDRCLRKQCVFSRMSAELVIMMGPCLFAVLEMVLRAGLCWCDKEQVDGMHPQLLLLERSKQGRSHTGQRDQIPVRSFGYAIHA